MLGLKPNEIANPFGQVWKETQINLCAACSFVEIIKNHNPFQHLNLPTFAVNSLQSAKFQFCVYLFWRRTPKRAFLFIKLRILPVDVFPFYLFQIEFHIPTWETEMRVQLQGNFSSNSSKFSLKIPSFCCCCQMCDMGLSSWADEHQHRMTPMIVTKTMMMTVITVTMTILANFHRPRPPSMDMSH